MWKQHLNNYQFIYYQCWNITKWFVPIVTFYCWSLHNVGMWCKLSGSRHKLSVSKHNYAFLLWHSITTIGPFTLAKTKTIYTARKTHNIQGFWHEKRMREKTWISYLCFGKWCACATSLYLWPYTCSAHYVAGRGRVIPLKVTYHVTKNPNNTGEIGASVYIGKQTVKFRRSFKKSRCGGGFFDSGFWSV